MKFRTMILGFATLAVMAGVASAQNVKNEPRPTDTAGTQAPGSGIGTTLGSATLFAVVNANGSAARGDGNAPLAGVFNYKIAQGTYDVRFFRQVLPCAYVGTIGLSGNSGASLPGFITVVGRAGTTNGVFVQTFNSAGQLADLGFHLFINC